MEDRVQEETQRLEINLVNEARLSMRLGGVSE